MTTGIKFNNGSNIIDAANKLEASRIPVDVSKLLYITSNDGKGHVWRGVTGDPAFTHADDGGAFCGTKFIPEFGDGSEAWIRDYDGSVGAEWYGITGDGVVDDTAALNALGALGVPVWFKAGTYLISGSVTMQTSSKFKANGDATIKLGDAEVANLVNGAMIYALSETDIEIDGLIIDGNKANNDINDNKGDGIRIQDCERVRVTNNKIINVPRDGVVIARLIAGVKGTDVFIDHNIITGSGAASQTTGGEGILIVEGEWAIITNNICRDNKLRGIEIEISSSTVVNTLVSNNQCDGNARGIGLNGNTQTIIVGNILSDNTEYGIDIRTLCERITVTGNYVDGSNVGIYLENSDFVTISGNVIKECVDGIRFNGVEKTTTIGNVIDFSTNTGIQFLSGTNADLIFSGNVISRSNQSASTKSNLDGNAIGVQITGNMFRDNAASEYGIVSAGSGWNIVANDLEASGVSGPLNDGASSSIIRNNRGYITETNGSSVITSGNTSVVVAHGLDITPASEHITITGKENPTNDIGNIWVSTFDATNFTVNVRNDPGVTNWNFGWKVTAV